MNDSCPPSPVFLVGSLRSGASLLSLAFGQHPRLALMMENAWLEPFMLGLQRSYTAATRNRAISQLDINGIELEDFFAHFGPAAERLMRGSGSPDGSRLIDATPANAFLITPLRLLFPRAKFIHILRDAPDVVAALTDPARRRLYKSQAIHCSEKEAYEHWLRAVSACVGAEHAYGSNAVMRLRRNELIAHPDEAIRGCLAFLSEEFDAACLRPFSSIPPEIAGVRGERSAGSSGAAPAAMRTSANLLGAVLSEEGSSFSPGDEVVAWSLHAAMWERWTRGERLVPPMPGAPRKVKRPQGAATTATPPPAARRVRNRFARLLVRLSGEAPPR